MDFRFSEDFVKVLEYSRDEAVRTGWHNICPDHIMLGLLRHSDNSACRALESLGVDKALFKEEIDKAVFVNDSIPWEARETVNLSPAASSLLKTAAAESDRCRSNFVEPIHFLLALSQTWGSYSHDWLEEHGISLKLKAFSPSPAKADPPAPDPELMAVAIEKRILEGYTTDNPHVS